MPADGVYWLDDVFTLRDEDIPRPFVMINSGLLRVFAYVSAEDDYFEAGVNCYVEETSSVFYNTIDCDLESEAVTYLENLLSDVVSAVVGLGWFVRADGFSVDVPPKPWSKLAPPV